MGTELPEWLRSLRAVPLLPARPRHAVVPFFSLSGLLAYTQAKHSVHGRRTQDPLRALHMESKQRRLDICREGSTTVICAPGSENRLSRTAFVIHLRLLLVVQVSPHTFLGNGVLHCPPHPVIAICPHRGLPLLLGGVGPSV
jgi:hypothetical protein